jgi:copper chaperone CopZ
MKLLKSFLILVAICFIASTTTFAQSSDANATASTEKTTVVNQVKTIKLKVKGVGCSRDMAAISASVAKLDGVSECKTLKKGAVTTFSVTYDAGLVEEKAIHKAVEGTPGCKNQAARPYKVKL